MWRSSSHTNSQSSMHPRWYLDKKKHRAKAVETVIEYEQEQKQYALYMAANVLMAKVCPFTHAPTHTIQPHISVLFGEHRFHTLFPFYYPHIGDIA